MSATPNPAHATAESMLRAALAARGITPVRDYLCLVVPKNLNTPAGEEMNVPHLAIAAPGPSLEHTPEEHTGWEAWLYDGRRGDGGHPYTVYDGTADGKPVDCAADSIAAAKAIAEFTGAPGPAQS
jgi:hypothetical protein